MTQHNDTGRARAASAEQELQPMPLPRTRHDAFFRLLVSDPARAGHLLRDHLPPKIAQALDPDSLPEHVEGTAIDEDGRSHQADAIFRVRLRGGGDAKVLAVLEHKARADPRTPLQLLRYMLRLWLAEFDAGLDPDGKLTPIIPILYYHGRALWAVPLSIQDMIRKPDGLEQLAEDFGHYTLVDLGQTPPRDLSRDDITRAGLLALARAFADTISAEEEGLLIAGIADTGFGRYFLSYIVEQLNLTPDRLTAALKRGRTDPDDQTQKEALMGTIAQAWHAEGLAEGLAAGEAKGLAEGKAEGLAEGEVKGEAKALTRLLTRRFGVLGEDVIARIADGSVADLELWTDRLLEAPTLAAVFAPRRDH